MHDLAPTVTATSDRSKTPDACDRTAILVAYLDADEDVIRCAAARALARAGDPAAGDALIERLLDDDPDVRTDAMTALATLARPEDAEAIRQSLIGDPIKEVKQAAIEALANLGDPLSKDLLLALARDRMDGEIAWEDDGVSWDDWLDIQTEAIEALGRLGDASILPALLALRDDEFGQDCDQAIFTALADLGADGIAALLGLLRNADPKTRQRALAALASAKPQLLAPMVDLFVRDSDGAIRQLALRFLNPENPAIETLALRDPDVAVRRAAVAAFAAQAPALARAALADTDEVVCSRALDGLVAQGGGPANTDLVINVKAWMITAGPALASSAARSLPVFAADTAQEPLVALASDADRPLEARLAGCASLGSLATPGAVAFLAEAAGDPVQQVRAAALAGIADAAKRGSIEAIDILAAAVAGDLVRLEPLSEMELEEDAPDAAAPKVEDRPGGIKISADGDIIEVEASEPPSEPEPAFHRSTLDAIMATANVTPARGDGAAIDVQKKRVAVAGPADIAADARLVAIRVAATCPGEPIEDALCAAATGAENPAVRFSATEALATRLRASLDDPDKPYQALRRNLGDDDPRLRGAAAQGLAASGDPSAADWLAPSLADPDALVRAAAVSAVGPRDAATRLASLSDPNDAVRRVALGCLVDRGDFQELETALRTLLAEGYVTTLGEACMRSATISDIALARLVEQELPRRDALALLNALGAHRV